MLEISNLTISYDNQEIIRGLDLRVPTGTSMALVGESGTGKTSLALATMGLCRGQVEGKIMLDEQDLLQCNQKDLEKIRWNKIAMVFQNVESALNPLYPVFSQVVEPITVHQRCGKKEAEKKGTAVLREVGLEERLFHHYPHQLSGGQKQRALIAMALANEPRLLILDEPTAALDPLTKVEIVSLLKQVKKRCSLLLITHHMDTAIELADEVAVLYNGRIVEKGPALQVLSQPRHPYTRGLLRSFPNMTTAKDLQGIPGQMIRSAEGCGFSQRCSQSLARCSSETPMLQLDKINSNREVACWRGGIVPVLEVGELGKAFDGFRALDKVSFTLYQGETMALVGESGSGKTTMGKLIMGLLPSNEGSVSVDGISVGDKRRRKEYSRLVQMVFQNPGQSISHRMTVLEAVQEPLDIHKQGTVEERKERVKEVLAQVELPNDEEFLQVYPHHMSGGEAQRVAIARALVLNPKLLIADEPTAALDPSVQAKVAKLLLNLQEQRGLSIVFITHDMALARKVSDRMLVLRSGQIVEEGPTSQVIGSPKSSYTQALVEAMPILESRCKIS
ncbi:peptide/nickel transport system ATP-binding protein [Desulfitispora alkaliphila]|uniref:ABC transporter ATP-binding protein n=1 Tax=Desulfitispora alkaliphila TaxID=622674 RepID=UPI003D1C1558